ncbi:MAG: hypothetical protein WAL56_01390 [Candidatus Sulfotelmatobacter sp.]
MLQSKSLASLPRRPRSTTNLNPTLDRHLAAYVAAAAAAGVSMLAATPAAAQIVYTPANIHIGTSGYALDLNHDETPDFTFNIAVISGSDGGIGILNLRLDVPGNAVRPNVPHAAAAGALPRGARIGPLKSFTSALSSYGGVNMYVHGAFSHTGVKSSFSDGPWVKQTNKFLGLRFLIGSRFHYGWARVTTSPGGTVLTGYAYENEPGHQILAGQISGNDAQPEFIAPMTLGELARGTAVVTRDH